MTKNVRIAKELVKLAKSLMVTAATGDGDGEEGNGFVPQKDESQIKSAVSDLLSQADAFGKDGEQIAQAVTDMTEQVQEIQNQVKRSLRIASRRGVNASDIANSIREFKIASIEFVDNCKSYSSALNKHRIACRRARQAGLGDMLKGIGNMFTKVKDDVLNRIKKNPKVQKEIQDVKDSGEEVGEKLAKLVESAKAFIVTLAKVVALIALGPIALVIWSILAIQKAIHKIGEGIAALLKKGKEEFIKLWDELNKWIDDVVDLCKDAVGRAKKATGDAARDIMKALYDALVKAGAEVTIIVKKIIAFFQGVYKGYTQYNKGLEKLEDNLEEAE